MTELIIKRSGISLYLVPTTIYIDGAKTTTIGNNKPESIPLTSGSHEMVLKCTWFPFFHSKHNIELLEGPNTCHIKEKSDTIKCLFCIIVILSIIGILLGILNSTFAGILIWGSIAIGLLFEIVTARNYFKIDLTSDSTAITSQEKTQ